MLKPRSTVRGGDDRSALPARSIAQAITITEFRKYSQPEQATFLSGAISMAIYNYAANGDPAKARCIRDWYYGKAGEDAPGPRQLAVELGIAERQDAGKFHVEGVILGLTDKVCVQKR